MANSKELDKALAALKALMAMSALEQIAKKAQGLEEGNLESADFARKTLGLVVRKFCGDKPFVIDEEVIDSMPGTVALMMKKERKTIDGKKTTRLILQAITEEEYDAMSDEEKANYEGNPFEGDDE